jgi:folate-dependent tRNA-U54 methylase TrmFO/GidA
MGSNSGLWSIKTGNVAISSMEVLKHSFLPSRMVIRSSTGKRLAKMICSNFQTTNASDSGAGLIRVDLRFI